MNHNLLSEESKLSQYAQWVIYLHFENKAEPKSDISFILSIINLNYVFHFLFHSPSF